MLTKDITTSVKWCARCGRDHERLVFRAFQQPVTVYDIDTEGMAFEVTYTHWASCPTNGDPILLKTDAVAPLPPKTTVIKAQLTITDKSE